MPQGLDEGNASDLPGLFGLAEGGCLVNPLADPQADEDEDRAQQEWNAPAPSEEAWFGEDAHRRQCHCAEQHTYGDAHLRYAAEEASVVRAGVLNGEQERTAPLPTDAQALDTAQGGQKDRCQNADRGVTG